MPREIHKGVVVQTYQVVHAKVLTPPWSCAPGHEVRQVKILTLMRSCAFRNVADGPLRTCTDLLSSRDSCMCWNYMFRGTFPSDHAADKATSPICIAASHFKGYWRIGKSGLPPQPKRES